MKNLKQLAIKNKRVFLRLELNVLSNKLLAHRIQELLIKESLGCDL